MKQYSFISEGHILKKVLNSNLSPSEIAFITSKLSKTNGKDNVWRKDLANALKRNRKKPRDVSQSKRGTLDMVSSLMDINLI